MNQRLTTLRKIPLKESRARGIPENPGVYIFWLGKTPIYIGKAKNLKNRVGSYFLKNLSPKTGRMIKVAETLSFLRVDSELESLLLEARLIRENQPRYNFSAKDDKHPLYIVITKEEYPRVLSVRKPSSNFNHKVGYSPLTSIFGPFPSSTSVHSVLKMLRRIFPFSDHKIGKRACIYNHLGLCNPCPSEIKGIMNEESRMREKGRYLKNIKNIKAILSGKIKTVKRELEKDMATFSKEEKFEEATGVRKQIENLDYITQPIIPTEYFLENPNLTEDLRTQELKDLGTILSSHFPHLTSIRRIECFDVAHLAGTNQTASMVTFINGDPDKSFYRHFRIRQTKKADDIASLTEVAKRRSRHFKAWGKPDLIIVDGGKTQVATFVEVLAKEKIPIIGLAKQFETIIVPILRSDLSQGPTLISAYGEVGTPRGPARNLVQRIRDEAHRFARRYHHFLTKKAFQPILKL